MELGGDAFRDSLAVNIALLIVRMLANPMRAYSELFLHFIGTYCFTITSLISLVMVIIYWKKSSVIEMAEGRISVDLYQQHTVYCLAVYLADVFINPLNGFL